MDLTELQTVLGAVLVFLLSLIKIPKIELNIWGWLGKAIRTGLNKDILAELKDMNADLLHVKDELKEFRGEVDTFRQEFLDYKEEDEENRIAQSRQQILIFNDEILQETRHSKERFDNILAEIDKYEKYCSEHPNYANNKAVLAIKNIKKTYEDCTKNHTFL